MWAAEELGLSHKFESLLATGKKYDNSQQSSIAYLIGITDIEPTEAPIGLIVDLGRADWPDIDMDIEPSGRELVKRYLRDKYGEAVGISTYTTYQGKNLIKDVSRCFGIDVKEQNELTKKIVDLDDFKTSNASEYYRNRYPEVVIAVDKLAGKPKSHGAHAGAVVVADRSFAKIAPIETRKDPDDDKKRVPVLAYEMNEVAELGLIKMDLLGNLSLTIIHETVDIIKERHGIEIAWENLEPNDAKVLSDLASGNTTGVFQMESSQYRRLLMEMGVDNFEDLVASNALVRPGAYNTVFKDYVRRKRGTDSVRYPHESVEAELRDTYGLYIYQEQVMQLVVKLGGFSWAKADKLRKIIGKKLDASEFKPYFDGWMDGASRFITPKVAEKMWHDFEAHSGYSFNRCAYYGTRVQLADGTTDTLSNLYKRSEDGEKLSLLSMWSDGEIRPHTAKMVVRTGRKKLYRVKTNGKRVITITEDHRLLTTRGYLPLKDIIVGDELVVAPKFVSDKARKARKANMTKLAHSPERIEQDKRAAKRMREYQSTLTFEQRSAHQKYVSATTNRTAKVLPTMNAGWKRKWENDTEWREQFIQNSLAGVREAYNTGPGYGHCSIASNGMWCASTPEREMCEYLIELGVDFEIHKPLANGRMCDFYFDGLYWEMDGMDRTYEYFEKKYGDLPFRVVTPEDYKFHISTVIEIEHIANGDEIISIEEATKINDSRNNYTFDIEMDEDGPKNFITSDGIVSHNSHAVCYSYIGYVTAWLKLHYPTEYMYAMLKHEKSETTRMSYLIEADRMHIPIMGPHVNSSEPSMRMLEDGGLQFGLGDIKGVGGAALNALMAHRPFESIEAIQERTDARQVNVKVVNALTYVGALDGLTDAPSDLNYEHNWLEYLRYPKTMGQLKLPLETTNCESIAENSKGFYLINAVVKSTKRTDTYFRIEFEDNTGTYTCFGDRSASLSSGDLCIALVGERTLLGSFNTAGIEKRIENGQLDNFERLILTQDLFNKYQLLIDLGIDGLDCNKSLVLPLSTRSITTKTNKEMGFCYITDRYLNILKLTFFPQQWSSMSRKLAEWEPICVKVSPLQNGSGWTIEGEMLDRADAVLKMKEKKLL